MKKRYSAVLARLAEQWKRARVKKEMDKAATMEFLLKLATSNFNRDISIVSCCAFLKKYKNEVSNEIGPIVLLKNYFSIISTTL